MEEEGRLSTAEQLIYTAQAGVVVELQEVTSLRVSTPVVRIPLHRPPRHRLHPRLTTQSSLRNRPTHSNHRNTRVIHYQSFVLYYSVISLVREFLVSLARYVHNIFVGRKLWSKPSLFDYSLSINSNQVGLFCKPLYGHGLVVLHVISSLPQQVAGFSVRAGRYCISWRKDFV